MRARIGTQIQDAEYSRAGWLRGVEHNDLARLIHGDEEARSIPRHAHQLGPTAFLDGSEIEDGGSGAGLRVDEIKFIVEHSCRVAAAMRITGDQPDVDGSARLHDVSRPQIFSHLQIPTPYTPHHVQPPQHLL